MGGNVKLIVLDRDGVVPAITPLSSSASLTLTWISWLPCRISAGIGSWPKARAGS